MARQSLRFLASFAKSRNSLWKSCHTSPSVGWVIYFSLGYCFELCHYADFDASLVTNILFSLGANEKCHNTFYAIFFLSGYFHLDRPQMGHSSRLAYYFLNNTQLLKHICIESYPRPNYLKRFFASLHDLGNVLHSGNCSAKSFTIAEKAELLILYNDFI
jgi:hypothetical protein